MNKKKKALFFVMFILTLISLIFINSFFVSSFPGNFQPTGFVFSDDAGVSLGISRSTAINVLRDDFDGGTTDFTVGGNIALETLTGMTLEHFNYGKIVFSQVVNLTKDAYSPTGTLYDRVVDIDSNLIISRNFISVKKGNLTSLNKSAIITLYRVDYESPIILRNGDNCPSSICHLVSYSGGIAIFTVSYLEHTSTTTYALAEEEVEEEDFCGDGICNSGETCSTCSTDCGKCVVPGEDGGGGGGAGGGTIGGRNVTINGSSFSVKPGFISVDIEKGKSYAQQVNISNTGLTDLEISVSPSSTISRFVELGERSFILKKGESRIYSFRVYSSIQVKADLYTGKILFSSNKLNVPLDIAVSVQELSTLFDMKITSTKEYVIPGRIASAQIRMVNIGDAEYVNAVLEYGVMDFNNVVYVYKKENVTVTRNVISKKVTLRLPEDIALGRYLIYSKLTYKDKIALSDDTFQVEQLSSIMWVIALILILILIVLVLFAILLVKKKKREKCDICGEIIEGSSKEELEENMNIHKRIHNKEEDGEAKNLIKDLLVELKKLKPN